MCPGAKAGAVPGWSLPSLLMAWLIYRSHLWSPAVAGFTNEEAALVWCPAGAPCSLACALPAQEQPRPPRRKGSCQPRGRPAPLQQGPAAALWSRGIGQPQPDPTHPPHALAGARHPLEPAPRGFTRRCTSHREGLLPLVPLFNKLTHVLSSQGCVGPGPLLEQGTAAPAQPRGPRSVGESDQRLHHVAHVLPEAALRSCPRNLHLGHLQEQHRPLQRAPNGHGPGPGRAPPAWGTPGCTPRPAGTPTGAVPAPGLGPCCSHPHLRSAPDPPS